MDFCNNQTIDQYFRSQNLDGVESQVILYKIFLPILLFGCLLSLILNAVLVAVGTASRRTIRSRSPILVLSLNLAATDSIASLLIGIGLLLNSFLPVVLNIQLHANWMSCFQLVLEILRLSALIASAMHLLSLALVHYKGIVNPLHYRSVIFCSQHRTRSIYLMSFICWLVPAVTFGAYFSSMPCQGFLTDSCRAEFIQTFRFRVIVVVAFFIPLILMSVLYIRIFAIIKRHQAARALQRQQSCQISVRTRSSTLASQVFHHDSPRCQSTPLVQAKSYTGTNRLEGKEDEDGYEEQRTRSINGHHRKLVVTSQQRPKVTTTTTTLYRKDSKIEIQLDTEDRLSCPWFLFGSFKSCHRTVLPCGGKQRHGSFSDSSEAAQHFPPSKGQAKTRADVTLSVRSQSSPVHGEGTTIGSSGHAKALVTTLLILGTYLLCYMPAVCFFALTCVDHCPFPITLMNFRSRVIFSFITNVLVILKAIVDPFIYTYRMKEMKTALNRRFAYLCPRIAATMCPTTSMYRSSSSGSRHFRDSGSRHSVQRSSCKSTFRLASDNDDGTSDESFGGVRHCGTEVSFTATESPSPSREYNRRFTTTINKAKTSNNTDRLIQLELQSL